MKCSPDIITSLKPNEIFVFGSNLAGIHGAGAAKLASDRFGARTGQGEGAAGQTYAIPTKDFDILTLPIEEVEYGVSRFIRWAKANPLVICLVTEIGCGLAGYQPKDIAPLFFQHRIPENVLLPRRFEELRPPA